MNPYYGNQPAYPPGYGAPTPAQPYPPAAVDPYAAQQQYYGYNSYGYTTGAYPAAAVYPAATTFPPTPAQIASAPPSQDATAVTAPKCLLHPKPVLNCKICRKFREAVNVAASMALQQESSAKVEKANALPLWGNTKTFNFNTMLHTNILASEYFKSLYALKTYHEVISEIVNHADHAEPWTPGKNFLPSTLFCCLMKLCLMRLTEKQVRGLLNSSESPFVRCTGFLFLRYTHEPKNLYNWLAPYLFDMEEFAPGTDKNTFKTMGQFVEELLTEQNYYGTILPRIPVPVARDIQRKLLDLPEKRQRKASNLAMAEKFVAGVNVKAISRVDEEWHEATITEDVVVEEDGFSTGKIRVKFADSKVQPPPSPKVDKKKRRHAHAQAEDGDYWDADEQAEYMQQQAQQYYQQQGYAAPAEPTSGSYANQHEGEGAGRDHNEPTDESIHQEAEDESGERVQEGDHSSTVDLAEVELIKTRERSRSASRDRSRDSRKISHDDRDSRDRKRSRSRSRDRSRRDRDRRDRERSRSRNRRSRSRSRDRRRRSRSRDRRSSRSRDRKDRRERSRSRDRRDKRKDRSKSPRKSQRSPSPSVEKTGAQKDKLAMDEILRRERDKATAVGKDYARKPASYKTSLSLALAIGTVRKRSRSRSPPRKERRRSPSGEREEEAPQKKQPSAEHLAKMQKLKAIYGDSEGNKAAGAPAVKKNLDVLGPDVMRLG